MARSNTELQVQLEVSICAAIRIVGRKFNAMKAYIGFRTMQPFLGRNKDDNPAKASRVYN